MAIENPKGRTNSMRIGVFTWGALMLLVVFYGSLRGQPAQEEQSLQSVSVQGRVVNACGSEVSDAPGIPGSQILLVQLFTDGSMHVLSSGQWITDSQGSFRIETQVSLSSILLVLTTTAHSQLHAVVDTSLSPGMTVDIGTINPATTIATNLFLQLYSAGVRSRDAYTDILANVQAEMELMSSDSRFIYRPRIIPSDSTESDSPFHSLQSRSSVQDHE